MALAITIAVLEFFIKANIEAKQTKVRIENIYSWIWNFIFLQHNFFDVMKRNMRLRYDNYLYIHRHHSHLHCFSIAGIDLEEKSPDQYSFKYPVQDNYHVKIQNKTSK